MLSFIFLLKFSYVYVIINMSEDGGCMKNKTCKDVINERRSTRVFSNEEVSINDVLEIIDAGRVAPSAKNRQPWLFYILSDKEKAEVEKMLVDSLNKNNTEATGFASAKIMKQASKVVLVFMDAKDEEQKITNLLSVGACIENMLLRATELDISNLWVYDICVVADELAKFGKEGYDLISAVYLGKSDADSKRAAKKELKDLVISK